MEIVLIPCVFQRKKTKQNKTNANIEFVSIHTHTFHTIILPSFGEENSLKQKKVGQLKAEEQFQIITECT